MRFNLDELEKYLGESIVTKDNRHGFLFVCTPHSQWLIKPIKRCSKAVWWKEADRLIRQNGFRSMPDFFVWKNKWFVMSYISGRTADYRHATDLEKCATFLARFHLAARHIPNTGGIEVRHTLPERLTKRLDQYHDYFHRLQYDPELYFVGEEYRQMGLRALERIEASSLKALTRADVMQGAIAHRDLASHNILLGQSGNPWLIDFETAGYDWQLGDLWQMMSRSLVEWRWDPDIYNHILRNYESVRPLSFEERETLQQLFLFPNDFYREVLGLLKRRSGFSARHVMPYLKTMIRHRERWYTFLKYLGVVW